MPVEMQFNNSISSSLQPLYETQDILNPETISISTSRLVFGMVTCHVILFREWEAVANRNISGHYLLYKWRS